MKELFLGCCDGSTYRALRTLPHPINVMVNYSSKVRSYPQNTRLRFLDSGGFSYFFKAIEFDNRIDKYVNFVLKHNVDLFANRDYPCEPELLKKRHSTVLQNQMRTLDNQIKIERHINYHHPELFNRFVAVLQGWEPDDYIFMADTLNDHGLLTDLVGIGSVCRRNSNKAIKDVIMTIHEQFPCLKLHGFGIKFGLLKDADVWEALHSVDSQAFRYNISAGPIPQWIRIQRRIENWLGLYGELDKEHRENGRSRMMER